jgi:hypothetical protein
MEKSPVLCLNILPVVHTGSLHSSMPEMSSGLWTKTFCRTDAGRFRKSLKTKMTGKTTGDSLQREGKSSSLIFIDYVYSLLIILYFLL